MITKIVHTQVSSANNREEGVKEELAMIANTRALARKQAPEILPKIIEKMQNDRKIIIFINC